jgi:hypothetical protein
MNRHSPPDGNTYIRLLTAFVALAAGATAATIVILVIHTVFA